MLTGKQLQDVERCHKGEISCNECSNKDNRCRRGRIFGKGTSIKDSGCMGKSAQTALALADMLERVERIDGEWCPICDGRFEHKADCELAALLKGLEGSE